MNGKMPVSALQELMAVRRQPLPHYREEGSGTQFKCTVYVENIKAVGYSTTKKGAKHESAKNALEMLQGSPQQAVFEQGPVVVQRPLKNFVGELNEYSLRNGLGYPSYDFVTATVNGQFIFKCTFLGKEVHGRGMNKKDAKQDAASNMLKIIDPTEPVVGLNSKYKKLTLEKTTFETEDTDEIISMFNKLSTQKHQINLTIENNIEPAPAIKIDEEDDLYDLEKQLEEHGVEYKVTQFQDSPYVLCLVIENTNFTFMAADYSREEALKKIYKNLLEVKKSGCSLTSDLTKFL